MRQTQTGYTVKEVLKIIGFSASNLSQVKKTRGLIFGQDWWREADGSVRYSEEGLNKLRRPARRGPKPKNGQAKRKNMTEAK